MPSTVLMAPSSQKQSNQSKKRSTKQANNNNNNNGPKSNSQVLKSSGNSPSSPPNGLSSGQNGSSRQSSRKGNKTSRPANHSSNSEANSSGSHNKAQPDIYGDNLRLLHTTSSLTGAVVQVELKSEETYEGVLKTFSPKYELVLETVIEVDKNSQLPPGSANIGSLLASLHSGKEPLKTMIFPLDDIVKLTANNIDVDYASKGQFQTDDQIAGNFKASEEKPKELVPWKPDVEIEESCEDLLPPKEGRKRSADRDRNWRDKTPSNGSNQNGWDPIEMFRKNESLGVKSTFDPEMKGYTLPLEIDDSEEGHKRKEMAEHVAQEIEKDSRSKNRSEVDQFGDEDPDHDEEDQFAAVQRSNKDKGKTESTKRGGKSPPGFGGKAPQSFNKHQTFSHQKQVVHPQNERNVSGRRRNGSGRSPQGSLSNSSQSNRPPSNYSSRSDRDYRGGAERKEQVSKNFQPKVESRGHRGNDKRDYYENSRPHSRDFNSSSGSGSMPDRKSQPTGQTSQAPPSRPAQNQPTGPLISTTRNQGAPEPQRGGELPQARPSSQKAFQQFPIIVYPPRNASQPVPFGMSYAVAASAHSKSGTSSVMTDSTRPIENSQIQVSHPSGVSSAPTSSASNEAGNRGATTSNAAKNSQFTKTESQTLDAAQEAKKASLNPDANEFVPKFYQAAAPIAQAIQTPIYPFPMSGFPIQPALFDQSVAATSLVNYQLGVSGGGPPFVVMHPTQTNIAQQGNQAQRNVPNQAPNPGQSQDPPSSQSSSNQQSLSQGKGERSKNRVPSGHHSLPKGHPPSNNATVNSRSGQECAPWVNPATGAPLISSPPMHIPPNAYGGQIIAPGGQPALYPYQLPGNRPLIAWHYDPNTHSYVSEFPGHGYYGGPAQSIANAISHEQQQQQQQQQGSNPATPHSSTPNPAAHPNPSPSPHQQQQTRPSSQPSEMAHHSGASVQDAAQHMQASPSAIPHQQYYYVVGPAGFYPLNPAAVPFAQPQYPMLR